MDSVSRTVDTGELMALYRELLPQSDVLPLTISGSSMTPYLADGRDSVYLSAPAEKLRVGDIVLYQRENGSYILHRICGVEREGVYTLIGDAHNVREHGVRRDQIFGQVRWVVRKGRKEGPGSFWWEFFRTVWVRIIPLRSGVKRLYGGLRRLFSGGQP